MILFLIRLAGVSYSIQPRKIQLFWGNCLGEFLRIFKLRQKIVHENLRIAFPGDLRTQKKINRDSYRHLGNLIFEILMLLGMFRPMRRFVLSQVEVTGREHIAEAQKKGLGVIALSSHLGNWEIMAATGGVITESNLMLVTKRIKPLWLHKAIEAARAECGVSATYEPKTLRQILSHLKKNGTVGFVLDQYSGAPVGVRVPLFGVPVGTSLALATLVKRTGAAVLPVENYRKPNGKWAVVVHPPLRWQASSENPDPHFELAANTAHYVQTLEKGILAHPSQWLWTHRRFKGDLSSLKRRGME